MIKERPRFAWGNRRSQKQPGRFLIEGEHLTYAEIALRLGVNQTKAEALMRAARRQDGPVTWERLKGGA